MRFKNGFSNGFEPGDDEDQWRGYYLIKKDKKNHFVFFCNSFSARRWRFEKKKKFFLVKISTASRPRNGDISSIQRTFFFFSLSFFFFLGVWNYFGRYTEAPGHRVRHYPFFFLLLPRRPFWNSKQRLKKKKESKRERGRGWTKKNEIKSEFFFLPPKK